MTIYVGNLIYEVTKDNLQEIFSEYGKVQRVHLPVDRDTGRVRGFGFIEMETEAEEARAIEALDGAQWMGRQIKVNKAKPREEREPRDDRSSGNSRRNDNEFSSRY